MSKDLDFLIDSFEDVNFLKNLSKIINSYFENKFDEKMKFLEYLDLVIYFTDMMDQKELENENN